MHFTSNFIIFILYLLYILCIFKLDPHTIFRILKVNEISKQNLILPIAFNILQESNGDSLQWTIINAGEKITVDDIEQRGDSLFINLPFFEAKIISDKDG